LLERQIEDLNLTQAGDAVKNLRLALSALEPDLDNQIALSTLRAAQNIGNLVPLISTSSSTSNTADWERWYKALLFLALESGFQSEVSEAVEDCVVSSSKDMSLAEPGVFAALLLLLKWRPATLEISERKLRITWRENDIGVLERIVNHFVVGPK
jgi:hypothetical protein